MRPVANVALSETFVREHVAELAGFGVATPRPMMLRAATNTKRCFLFTYTVCAFNKVT